MLRFLAIVSLSTSALAADAHAQSPGETAVTADTPLPAAPTSYRRQLMIADGLAVGTVGAAIAAGTWLYEPDDFHLPLMAGGFGFTSYVITAPIIHFAHGNVGRGFLSGAARVLLPAIAGVTLSTAMGLEEEDDGYGAAFFGGFALGAVGAIGLDWFVLTPSAEAEHPTPLVAPTISASAEHVFVGVGGSL